MRLDAPRPAECRPIPRQTTAATVSRCVTLGFALGLLPPTQYLRRASSANKRRLWPERTSGVRLAGDRVNHIRGDGSYRLGDEKLQVGVADSDGRILGQLIDRSPVARAHHECPPGLWSGQRMAGIFGFDDSVGDAAIQQQLS